MGAPLFSIPPHDDPTDEQQSQLQAVELCAADAQPTPTKASRGAPPPAPEQEQERDPAPATTASAASDLGIESDTSADTGPQPDVAVPEQEPHTLEPRVIGAIAIFVFEAVEGTRQVAQLGKWITETVAAELSELRRLNVERRSLYNDRRRIVPVLQRVRATRPAHGVTEAAVVLATPSRARAVALRFETIRNRWRATSITVM